MKRQRDRRNEAEAFTFVNTLIRSIADLCSQSNLLPQITTDTSQSTQPHTITYPKVTNVVHREIDGQRVSTLNTLKNTVSSLPPITSTSTTQNLNNPVNDEVSYHPMLIDEPDFDTVIPELENALNQESRRQVRSLH
jgi:hypothetical protein